MKFTFAAALLAAVSANDVPQQGRPVPTEGMGPMGPKNGTNATLNASRMAKMNATRMNATKTRKALSYKEDQEFEQDGTTFYIHDSTVFVKVSDDDAKAFFAGKAPQNKERGPQNGQQQALKDKREQYEEKKGNSQRGEGREGFEDRFEGKGHEQGDRFGKTNERESFGQRGQKGDRFDDDDKSSFGKGKLPQRFDGNPKNRFEMNGMSYGCQNGRNGFLEERSMFDTEGCQCENPFESPDDMVMPFPQDCKVFQTRNQCNKFEMTQDRKIKSCFMKSRCEMPHGQPKCLQFHKKQRGIWENGAESKMVGMALALAAVGSQWF